VTLTEGFTPIALIVVISALGVVQIPIDMKTRHLSRPATLFALTCTTGIGLVSSWQRGSLQSLLFASALAGVLGGIYYFVHRLEASNLGFGDVLLVLPLAFAVAMVNPERLLVWQLLSAVLAAIHGLYFRLRKRGSHLPFGPHLICGALIVIASSL